MVLLMIGGVIAVLMIAATVRLVLTDGLGSRPAPRSHREQTLDSTWPQRDEWHR